MSCEMAQSDLRRHYYALSTSMSPTLVEQITYFLYSTRILSQYELNVISSKSEMLSKASELLSAVLRKGKKACGIFFQALEMSDPHLSKEITGKQVNSTGHTPQAPSLLGLAPSTKPLVSKPQSTVEASLSQKEALDMKSHTCGSSNEKNTSSTEAVQAETDIKILRCKVRNMTVGNRNTFTVVEESSDEGDNEEKELEEEYEENECEEKDDAEQLINERG
ncbi:uncharacterized protein LOC144679379 isoform X2 [Cetorhinus maximus]